MMSYLASKKNLRSLKILKIFSLNLEEISGKEQTNFHIQAIQMRRLDSLKLVIFQT